MINHILQYCPGAVRAACINVGKFRSNDSCVVPSVRTPASYGIRTIPKRSFHPAKDNKSSLRGAASLIAANNSIGNAVPSKCWVCCDGAPSQLNRNQLECVGSRSVRGGSITTDPTLTRNGVSYTVV